MQRGSCIYGLGLLVCAWGAMAAEGRLSLPPLPEPAVTFHVAPSGQEVNPGTEARPFGSLEQARDAIRALRRRESMLDGRVEVVVHGGVYRVQATFRLSEDDSGTPEAPILYRAAPGQRPRFSGGVRLEDFRPVTDPAVLGRLPEVGREQVMEVDLAAAGVSNLVPFVLGGFSSGRGFRTHPAMELFMDDEPMTLARWPNEGFVKTVEVEGPLTLTAWDNKAGTPEGRFRYEGDRPGRWVNEPEAWLYGYWFWDWADSYEKIAAIDPEERLITLERPWHRYGYRKEQRYFALNLLGELDAPGEWYLDRGTGRLFFYPPKNPAEARVELSTTAFGMVEFDGVSHVRLEGLMWELGGADGVKITGGEACSLVGCTIRKLAGNGVEVQGGSGHSVVSCDIHTLGRGGVRLSGGDRRTLTLGGHVLENCHIHHLSRIDHTYTPGVWLNGVGNRVRHNRIHHVASSAMRVEGNDHVVELNEVHDVVLESDDQGGADMWGNPTYRGVVFRHNYWHHLGSRERLGEETHTGQAGIRLDDAISGVLVQGNVFHRCSAGEVGFGGVQIHGGKDNLIEGNLFADCRAAVSFTPWGAKRWREFVDKSLEDRAIDRELYLRNYPALARLAEGADVNTVRGNVALRCGQLLLRAPAGTVAVDNREVNEEAVLREDAAGRLVWDEAAAERLVLGGIPFEEIGLYRDVYRRAWE